MTTDEIAEVRELKAYEVDALLVRRHGWSKANACALGGYKHGKEWRFPIHGIRAWQMRQAEEYAQERAS